MNQNYPLRFKRITKDRVIIFIDVANLEQSVKAMWVNSKDIPERFKNYQANQLCWRVDYQKLRSFFEQNCNLQRVHFYSPRFGTDNHERFLTFLKKIRFNLITKPLKKYRDHSNKHPHRKANFDVEIAVDAIQFSRSYDTFILFSGDCDFEYLLKTLRKENKTCIVFSRKSHIAKELFPVSNHYFDIAYFRFHFLKVGIRKKS